MASLTQTGASGHGKAAISGGATIRVLEVYVKVTAFGDQTTVQGAGDIRRVWHAGWIAVGINVGGGFPSRPTWSKYISEEAEDHFEIGLPNTLANEMFWDLGPGVTINFEVDW